MIKLKIEFIRMLLDIFFLSDVFLLIRIYIRLFNLLMRLI